MTGCKKVLKYPKTKGPQMAQLIKCLPTAQIMIPGVWDPVLNGSPCSAESLLPPLPGFPIGSKKIKS